MSTSITKRRHRNCFIPGAKFLVTSESIGIIQVDERMPRGKVKMCKNFNCGWIFAVLKILISA